MTDWLAEGRTAVITGAAGGIGLAAARRFAEAGMNIVLADIKADALSQAETQLREAGAQVCAQICDVTNLTALEHLREFAEQRFGAVHCLMNNAGIARMGTKPWENFAGFQEILDINLMSIVQGSHVFIPSMLAHGQPGAVINTASKQGITRPPGNYAYNLSKAGVLAYSESLAHAFRAEDTCALKAHVLIPGFVYTPMIEAFIPQKPDFAATAEETVSFMLERLEEGDFYILCPDNETPRTLDEKRIQWTADDIIQNRPALSRWHPAYADAYQKFIAQ